MRTPIRALISLALALWCLACDHAGSSLGSFFNDDPHPTITLVSRGGRIRRIAFNENPKLYKVVVLAKDALASASPKDDADSYLIDHLDLVSPGSSKGVAPEVTISRSVRLFATTGFNQFSNPIGHQRLADAARAIQQALNGLDDQGYFEGILKTAKESWLSSSWVWKDQKAWELILKKAPSKPTMTFRSDGVVPEPVEYLKNPKLYSALSHTVAAQRAVGESEAAVQATACGVLEYFSEGDGEKSPFSVLATRLTNDRAIMFHSNPDAQRRLTECIVYLQSIAPAHIYTGD